jgi:hypothetical protein
MSLVVHPISQPTLDITPTIAAKNYNSIHCRLWAKSGDQKPDNGPHQSMKWGEVCIMLVIQENKGYLFATYRHLFLHSVIDDLSTNSQQVQRLKLWPNSENLVYG